MFQKVEIVQVSVQGFRGFEMQHRFEFQNGINTFVADNGKGKTSVSEVIAWVLTGRSFEGKQKDLNVINKKAKKAMGLVVFKDETGTLHEVERKFGGNTTLKYNGQSITQKRMEELIPADLFLSVFNPLYFLSLDRDASREMILSLMPSMTKEEILDEMNKYESEALEKESFDINDTNMYLKIHREKLRLLDEDRKHLLGYMEKLKEVIVLPTVRTFDANLLVEVEKAIQLLKEQKPVLKNMEKMLEEKGQIERKMTETRMQTFSGVDKRQALVQEKALLSQESKMTEQTVFQPKNISALQSEYDILKTNYRNLQDVAKGIEKSMEDVKGNHVHLKEGDTCPLCKQSVTKEAFGKLLEQMQKELDEKLSKLQIEKEAKAKALEEIGKRGKVVASEIELEKELLEKSKKDFEQEKMKKIQEIAKRVTEIDALLGSLEKEENTFKKEVQNKLNNLQKDLEAVGIEKIQEENRQIQANFDAEMAEKLKPLQERFEELRKQREEVLKDESLRESKMKEIEKQKVDIQANEVRLEKLDQEEAMWSSKINLMKSFNAKKMDMVNKKISDLLPDVSIRLQKTIETTGEIKDVFEILYNERELKICSTAETVKAGLQIAQMISEMANREYPTFVDNRESITSYVTDIEQIIEAVVEKGKELTMIKNGKEQLIIPFAS